MATDIQIIESGRSWYVVTPEGRFGPMETEQEAINYAKLLQVASAAGSETACTDAECLI
jgi:hypothetical protein